MGSINVRNIPETTFAWLAALIDGEGSMVVNYRFGKHRFRRPRYRIMVMVYNTDQRLMNALAEKTGINRVSAMTRGPKENHHKIEYRWSMITSEQKEWLPKLLPWLVCKQEQAKLLLEVIGIRRTITPVKGEKWVPLNEVEQLGKRITEIYEEMKKLNRKGRHQNVGEN